jgi:hypothetical protein
MCAAAGDVLLHGRFDCHLDKGGVKGPLQILRLPWPHDTIEGQFRVRDPDALARLAEIDPERAAARLYEELRPIAARERYWLDDLADALRYGSDLPLQEWAEIRGFAPPPFPLSFTGNSVCTRSAFGWSLALAWRGARSCAPPPRSLRSRSTSAFPTCPT